jgi:general secretion pathway protein D
MMRNFCVLFVGLFLGFLVTKCSAAAEPAASFDLSAVTVGQAVSLYYKEVSTGPYVVCNDVLQDSRLVSVRAGGRVLDGAAMRALLAANGYEAVVREGVTVVCKRVEQAVVPDHGEPFLYRVRHRDAAYLVDLLQPLVVGTFANKRGGLALGVGGQVVAGQLAPAQPGQGAVGAMGQPLPAPMPSPGSTLNSALGDDYLVFSGAPGEVRKLKALLVQLDQPVGEVLVKAYMYEVGKSASDVSALQLVAGVLGGKLGVSVGPDPVSNLVRIRAGSVDLVASALASDARFKVVSSPFVRLRSGKTARFVSGGQQSILGAILTNNNGSTQQSYERVDSGTILEVSPLVRGDGVDVDLFQQVSNFVAAPGAAVGQPPILNKRELRTSLSMEDGEVVVLAGLNDSKEEAGSSGLRFLPFKLGKSSSASSSELVLVLEMKRL